MRCDRCGGPTRFFQTSRFNLEDLCPACLSDEKAAPGYELAFKTEAAMVRLGQLNFPGIGLSTNDRQFLRNCLDFRRSFVAAGYVIGSPVHLVREVERYPHGVWARGTRGQLTTVRPDLLAVRLEIRYEALLEWGNELHWYPMHGNEHAGLTDFFQDVEPVKAEVL